MDRAPKFKTYAEPKQRIRWISKDEAEVLLAGVSGWLAELARVGDRTAASERACFGVDAG